MRNIQCSTAANLGWWLWRARALSAADCVLHGRYRQMGTVFIGFRVHDRAISWWKLAQWEPAKIALSPEAGYRLIWKCSETGIRSLSLASCIDERWLTWNRSTVVLTWLLRIEQASTASFRARSVGESSRHFRFTSTCGIHTRQIVPAMFWTRRSLPCSSALRKKKHQPKPSRNRRNPNEQNQNYEPAPPAFHRNKAHMEHPKERERCWERKTCAQTLRSR